MKQLTTFLLSIALGATAWNAQAQSCCAKPTEMQTLALNKSFKALHEPPLPLNYIPEKGSMITFPVTGDKDGQAFYVPTEHNTNKVLIIVHEWWGLNDYIKREAERWQHLLGDDVAVYAIDLYDGEVAKDPETAGKLMAGLTTKRGDDIVKGLLTKIGRDKKIATLGWCMGGSWSFTTSVYAGREDVGCVMYYGFPEKDDNRIKPLKADVLYVYAEQDKNIKKEDVEALGKKVKSLTGHTLTIHSFDAVHAFANPSNPKYNVKAATEAQALALKFLKGKLDIK